MRKALKVLVSLLGYLSVTSCGPSQKADTTVTPATTAAPAPTAASMWVVAWGASPENAASSSANPGGAEQTFRSFFYPSVSGSIERVRFSNFFGTTPVTIGAARLAIAATPPAIDPTHDVALSFNGSPSITLAPGTEIMSDPVSVAYAFGQKMAVTAYVVGAFAPLNQHNSLVTTNYSSVPNAGNTTTDAAGALLSQPNSEWFLVSGMDVYGQYQGTVAIFGSSTIDGFGSNLGNTNAYPIANVAVPGQDNDRISDALARSLNSAGYHIGVLNAGTRRVRRAEQRFSLRITRRRPHRPRRSPSARHQGGSNRLGSGRSSAERLWRRNRGRGLASEHGRSGVCGRGACDPRHCSSSLLLYECEQSKLWTQPSERC